MTRQMQLADQFDQESKLTSVLNKYYSCLSSFYKIFNCNSLLKMFFFAFVFWRGRPLLGIDHVVN